MRISDWSSDVCSSDLLWPARAWSDSPPARTTTSAGHSAAPPQTPARLTARTAPPRPAHGSDAMPMQHRPDTARAEIGRASCRERECQYVWISVVAVSLKKTKKKMSTHVTKNKG